MLLMSSPTSYTPRPGQMNARWPAALAARIDCDGSSEGLVPGMARVPSISKNISLLISEGSLSLLIWIPFPWERIPYMLPHQMLFSSEIFHGLFPRDIFPPVCDFPGRRPGSSLCRNRGNRISYYSISWPDVCNMRLFFTDTNCRRML